MGGGEAGEEWWRKKKTYVIRNRGKKKGLFVLVPSFVRSDHVRTVDRLTGPDGSKPTVGCQFVTLCIPDMRFLHSDHRPTLFSETD